MNGILEEEVRRKWKGRKSIIKVEVLEQKEKELRIGREGMGEKKEEQRRKEERGGEGYGIRVSFVEGGLYFLWNFFVCVVLFCFVLLLGVLDIFVFKMEGRKKESQR